jgi:hypothetical protein
MLEHARELHDLAELAFAPSAPNVWRPQGTRQRSGRQVESADLLGERAEGGDPVSLRLGQTLIDPFEGVLDRLPGCRE